MYWSSHSFPIHKIKYLSSHTRRRFMEKKNFLGRIFKKEQKFTLEQVQELVEKIKEFNSGAIDHHLTKHVDNAFQEWIKKEKNK